MNDVNGKQFTIGDWVNVPCRVEGVNQVGNRFVLKLKLKYLQPDVEPALVETLDGVSNVQVVKLE